MRGREGFRGGAFSSTPQDQCSKSQGSYHLIEPTLVYQEVVPSMLPNSNDPNRDLLETKTVKPTVNLQTSHHSPRAQLVVASNMDL